MKTYTLSAFPDQVERWKQIAQQKDRSLSWWARTVLEAAARSEAKAENAAAK